MALLKTYTISTDITGGVLDVNTLSKEIEDSGNVTGYLGLLHADGSDSFEVHGTSWVNEAATDTLVLNHVPSIIAMATGNREIYIDASNSNANSGTFNGIACTASPTAILYDRWIFRSQDKNFKNNCTFETELKSDYVDGNDITIEVDWTTSITTGSVVMYLGLTKENGVLFGGETETTYVQKILAAPATSGWERLSFSNTFDGTGLQKGDSINIVILRDGGDASDDLNGSSYIRGVKITY